MSPIDAPYRPLPARYWLIERLWRVEHALAKAKERRSEQDTPIRIFFVLVVFAAAFATLAAGASRKALWSGASRSDYVLPAVARADLTDRNGNIMAVDLTHYGVYIDPREVWDATVTRQALAAALPNVPGYRLDRVMHGKRRAYLVGDLTPQEKQRIHDLGLPGVSFQEEDHRVYPLGASAAHMIGFVDKGGQGLSGAELGLNDLIQEQGKTGQPVALSIDSRVQAALEDEVQKAATYFQVIDATGIVVDIHTGEILGMVSYPDFDPNKGGRNDPSTLVNHVAASVHEPGSVFKVFTMAMGLDSGVADVNTKFDVRTPLALSGRSGVIHDYDKGDTYLPLWEVFTHSSNIGSARLALLAGEARVERYFRSFGLFEAAPSELTESARPIAPKRMSDNTVASMAFGHAISVSPLALATGMTAILNGGEYIPLTIRKMEPGDRPQGRRVIKESTSRTMLDLMRLNVTNGSGGKANAPGLRVGGKTGSAEKAAAGGYARNKLYSSFAAVFPTDGPMNAKRYLVLIQMNEPHATKETYGFATGGWTAAPVAGRVIDRIAPFVGVKRAAILPTDPNAAAAAEKLLMGGDR